LATIMPLAACIADAARRSTQRHEKRHGLLMRPSQPSPAGTHSHARRQRQERFPDWAARTTSSRFFAISMRGFANLPLPFLRPSLLKAAVSIRPLNVTNSPEQGAFMPSSPLPKVCDRTLQGGFRRAVGIYGTKTLSGPGNSQRGPSGGLRLRGEKPTMDPGRLQ
jgi:hypothetical protein